MEPVRRPDDEELLGFVDHRGDRWHALAVFGTVLGSHDRRVDAVQHVHRDGLAALAERWLLRHGESGAEDVVCIVEANAHAVTVALGYYSLPGVPTRTITAAQLAAGEWEMRRTTSS